MKKIFTPSIAKISVSEILPKIQKQSSMFKKSLFTFWVILGSLLFSDNLAYGQFTATWALTADQTVAKAGAAAANVTAASQVMSSTLFIPASSPYTGTNNVAGDGQRCSPKNGGTDGSWLNDGAVVAGRYMEFVVNPNAGFSMNVSAISFFIGNRGSTNARGNAYYYVGTDNSGFTTSSGTALGTALTSGSSSNTYATQYNYTSLNISVAAGSKIFVRIYPYRVSSSGTSAYFVTKSVVVTGTTASTCTNPTFSTQPTDNQSECVGGSLTLGTVVADQSPTYQWYSNTTKTNSGGTTVGSGNGGSTATFTPSSATAGTYYYYCVATNGSCATASSAVQITVNAATAITGQPSPTDANYAVGATATALTVTATGTGLTYQWYKNGHTNSNSGGTTVVEGVDGTGGQTASFTPSTATADYTYFYCVVSGSCSPTSVTSNVSGKIDVQVPACTPPAFSTQPTDNQSECVGGSLTLGTVVADQSPTYQWYSNTTKTNTGGTSVGSANGGSTATFTPSSSTAGTYYYYCVATSGICTTPSAAVQITINGLPAISSQSTAGASYSVGGTASALTVTATGAGLTYQWYSSTDNSNNTAGDDVSIGGANSNSYTPSTASAGTTYYYCVVSGTCTPSVKSAISGAIVVSPYAVGDFGSVASSTWATAATWKKWDGSGWNTTAAAAPTASDNVWIVGGFTVTVGASGTCKDLHVTNGILKTGTAVNSIQTITVAGTTIEVTTGGTIGNGLEDNSADGISITCSNTGTTTITGTGGAMDVSKLIQSGNNGILVINRDLKVRYHGSGNGGNASALYPTAANNTLTINAGKTLTIAKWASIYLNSNSGNLVSQNYTMNINGTLTFEAGSPTDANDRTLLKGYLMLNTVATFTAAINVGTTGTLTVQDFYPNGSSNTGTAAGTTTIAVASGGILNIGVNGDFSRSASQTITGAGTVNILSGATLRIASLSGITASSANGPIQTTTRNYNTGAKYVYSGAAAQAAGDGLPATVAGLTINNAAGVTIGSDLTVNGVLTFTTGNLTTGANKVIITSAGSVSRTSGHVVGKLQKTAVDATATVFEIGTTVYAPSTLTVNGVSGAVDLTASVTAGNPTSGSGVDPTKKVDHYWTVDKSGAGTFTSYSAKFDFTNTTNTGTVANYKVKKYTASSWAATTSSVTGTTITATGLTSFSDFEVGELLPCTAPTINTHPVSSTQSICVGGVLGSLFVEATGTSISYQWYKNTTASNTGGTILSGETFDTYTPPTDVPSQLYYYCVITNDCGGGSTSSLATNVSGLITVTNTVGGTASGAQSVCTGSAPSSNLTVNGYTGLGTVSVVKWQYSSDNFAGDVHDISNASATLTGATIGALTSSTYFRAVITSDCGTANSSSVLVTVTPLSVAGTVSANQNICSGATPTQLSIGTSVGTIQWQVSTTDANSGFSNIGGATASTYSPAALTQTTYYRAVVTSGACSSVNSDPITVTVDPSQQISLTSGSATQTVCINTAITDIVYTGNAAVSGAGVTGLPSGVTGTYNAGVFTISGTPTQSGTFNYTVTTTGTCIQATANGTITVNAAPSAGTVSSSQAICSGATPAQLSISATVGTIQWQVSTTDANSGFSNIGGATTTTYTPGALTQTTYYRVIASVATCTSSTSNAVTITVNPLPSNATGASSNSRCGTGTVDFSVTDPGAGFAVDWFAAASGGTSLFTGVTYSPSISSTTTYHAEIRNTTTGCKSAARLAVTGTVNNAPSISVNPSSANVSYDQNLTATALTVTAAGTGISYQWYSNTSASNSGGTLIGGATSSSYTPSTATIGILYYYCVVSGTCSPAATSNVSGAITVNQGPLVFEFVTATATSAPIGYQKTNVGTYYKATGAGTITFGSASCDGYAVSAPTGSSLFVFSPAINASSIVVRGTGSGANRTFSSMTSSATLASGYTSFSASATGTIANPTAGTCGAITITPSTIMQAGKYYSIVFSGNLNVTSILVYPCTGPTFTTQPTDNQVVCKNATPTLGTVVATGAGTTYQWYSNTTKTNTGGTIIGGATSASYSPSTATAGTYYFYCVATPTDGCTSASNAVQLTVNPDQSISRTSAVGTDAQTVCVNTAITNIVYTGNSVVTGASASGLPTGVSGSYSSGVYTISGTPTVPGTYNYTVTSTGSCGAASQANGSIIVSSAPAITAESLSGATYTAGATAASLSVTATNATTYQWYKNTVASTTGGTFVGTSNTYTPPTTTVGTLYYYCVVSGGCSPAVISNVSGAIVIEAPLVPTIAIDQSGFSGSFGNVNINSTSAERSFVVSGSSLTDDIHVTAPAGFEVSTSSGSGFGSSVTLTQTSGNVGNTTIYVRFAPTVANAYSDNIVASSTDATNVNIAVSGTGTIPTITLSSSATLNFSVTGWTTSISQNIATVTGANLNTNISVSVSAPFEISTDNTSFGTSKTFTQTAGSASGTLYVRYNPTALNATGSDNATITFTSTGATNKTVSVTGKAGPTIALSSAAATTTQIVKAGVAMTNITYAVTGGVASSPVTGLPTGVSGSYSNGVLTISGTPAAQVSYPAVYSYTVTINGVSGASPALVTATGTITVKDPNAKRVAYMTATASPTNQLYNQLINYYDVTVYQTTTASGGINNTAAYTDAIVATNPDLIVLHESVPSGTLSAQRLGTYIGQIPILNTKAHMYGNSGWPAGSPNNGTAGTSVSVTVNPTYLTHPVFAGATFSGNSVTMANASAPTGNIRWVDNPTTTGQKVLANNYLNTANAVSIMELNTAGTNSLSKYMLIALSAANENLTTNGLLVLRNASSYLMTKSITASAGSNGSISPSGEANVAKGSNQTYTITPAANYIVQDVLVDGVSVGAVSSYTFTNLSSNHTISASFALCTGYTFTGAIDNDYTKPGNWQCGIVPPASGAVTIANGSGKVRLTSNLDVTGSLDFTNTVDTFIIAPGVRLTASGSGSINFHDNAVLIKSDATGTGSIGQITGTLSGTANVTAERYIRQNTYRGWRLLAVPVTTAGQTIRQSWQEGATTYTADPNPGFGTRITASTANAVANGFDAQTFGNSLLQYTGSSWSGFTGSLLTTKVSRGTAADAWMLYVRGDRGVDTAGVITAPTQTVLRVKGPLYTAPYPTVTIPAGTNGLVGNILPSEIDFTLLNRGGGADNAFYLWDPQLYGSYGLGGYQTFSANTPIPWKPVPGGGSYGTTPSSKIQSGLGFMVHASGSDGTIQLTEACKTSGSNVGGSGFRPVSPTAAIPYLETNLYAAAPNNTFNLADGNIVGFDDSYSNDIDNKDNIKVQGFGDGIGMVRGTTVLSAEQRKLIVSGDVIPYRMTNLKKQAYKLEFTPSGLDNGATAVLEDKYLNTTTPFNLSATSSVVFNADPAVAASFTDRFRIVFSTPTPVTITNLNAQQKNTAMQIDWKVAVESGVKEYAVEHSTDGVNFTQVGVVSASANNGGSATYSLTDANPVAGTNYYRIKTVDLSGVVKYTTVVRVVMGTVKSSIELSSTVITNNQVSLQLNNQDKGRYGIRLISSVGQELMTTNFTHNGGNSTQVVSLPTVVSKGLYQLEITRPNGAKLIERIVVN
ncbi:hypothetical protein LK994_00255 [Ferruginibacter lapsinanis]|uniref:beta strand repeat-containing protein n=1 Tax=Ferruginibacter lapsinanis TaxID=563172 RepID=UPI001E61D48E|nr:hypothetical protein [Ferruginibacter lapsinanis]UEG49902.1 hypothetical protein LK994_00255 [Ferruginibacter lapsinanis]